MNFLNAIDNILENGFVRQDDEYDDEYTTDDDYSRSTTATDRIEASGTWSEDDDDDDDESTDQVRLAFASNNVIEEEKEEDLSSSSADSEEETKIQGTSADAAESKKSYPLPSKLNSDGNTNAATAAVRPGNIRLRMRQDASSDEEESDSDDEEEKESNSPQQNHHTTLNPSTETLSSKNIHSPASDKLDLPQPESQLQAPEHDNLPATTQRERLPNPVPVEEESLKPSSVEKPGQTKHEDSWDLPKLLSDHQQEQSATTQEIEQQPQLRQNGGRIVPETSDSCDQSMQHVSPSCTKAVATMNKTSNLPSSLSGTSTEEDNKTTIASLQGRASWAVPALSPLSFSSHSNQEELPSPSSSTLQPADYRKQALQPYESPRMAMSTITSAAVAGPLYNAVPLPGLNIVPTQQQKTPMNVQVNDASKSTNFPITSKPLQSENPTPAAAGSTKARDDPHSPIRRVPVPTSTQSDPTQAILAPTPTRSNKQLVTNNFRTQEAQRRPPPVPIPVTGDVSANVSVASSGWSWPTDDDGGAATDDEMVDLDASNPDEAKQDSQPQTIVEASFLQQEGEKASRQSADSPIGINVRTSQHDFTDEEVKALASELEEIRSLVDAVGHEDLNSKHVDADTQHQASSQAPSKGEIPLEHTGDSFNQKTTADIQSRMDESDNSKEQLELGPIVTEDGDTTHTPIKPKKVTPSSPFEVERFTTTWNCEFALCKPLNCYGAFHVRILRAQRLPCPIGSSVQAVVSLSPWKGKARTPKRTTFLFDQEKASSFDPGVCAVWDNNQADSASAVSLVHAYTSEATPIPTLNLQLVMSPLKMLEFSMCSLTLPCDGLMKRPNQWTRQWFLADMSDVKTSKNGEFFGEDQRAAIEISAVFVPEDRSLGSSFVNLGQLSEVEDDMAVLEPNCSDLKKTGSSQELAKGEAAARNTDELAHTRKSHLLKVKKFWKPAACVQCGKSLFGWNKASFRCEVCGLDCCGDCRLHVDVQLPCGSTKATELVSKAIQNKLTVTRFLETMAPVDEVYDQKKRENDGELSVAGTRTFTESGTVSRGEKGRIGVLKLKVARACVFSEALPPVAEPQEVTSHNGELRPGEYYVKVSRTDSEGFARTRSIPSGGNLEFGEGSDMRLDASHYGVHFFIEVVDALTDKPVGTTVLTTQGLLQEQRDLQIQDGSMAVLGIGMKAPVFKGKRRMTLELRTGIRSGVSSDFFVPSDSKEEKGTISGWVELSVGFEEDVNRLFGSTPYECPEPPPDGFDPALLVRHIGRIGDLLEDLGTFVRAYVYLVSWRNPVLTGYTFAMLVCFSIKFDSEYVGCLPFLLVMLFMLYSAVSRTKFVRRASFVDEEAKEWREAEKETGVKYSLHRPIGRINVSITKGENILSRELGLPGNACCRVYYDPLRFASTKQRQTLVEIDKSNDAIHEIGTTDYVYKSNPAWETFKESDESKRLKQVLPHHGNFFEDEANHGEGCEFPFLQPFKERDDEGGTVNSGSMNAELEPWSTSTGGIVFQIRFLDPVNLLLGSEQIFGEVVIPLSTVVERREMSGWYHVLDVGTKDFFGADETLANGLPGIIETDNKPVVSDLSRISPDDHSAVPKVFLSVKWTPPDDSKDGIETEREASMVVQEELLRWEVMSREREADPMKKIGALLAGGAYNETKKIADLLRKIQNILGQVANAVEAVRNLLNFTDPFKSTLVFFAVTLVWLVLSVVPTRVVFLAAVLAQFGITAKARLESIGILSADGEDADDDCSEASGLEDDEDKDAIGIWVQNAFRSLPTDEDLRKAYFWEGRRIGAKTRETYSSEKRQARLQRLWRAEWHGTLKIRVDAKNQAKKGDTAATCWEPVFALVQGRRFLWWKTAMDFDSGSAPLGRILLSGHAGLAGLSPLEMREINPKDVPLVVGIFGRGLQGQQRITLLLPSAKLKDSLEDAIIDASVVKEL